MNLSFNPQFVKSILSGEKIHTIRTDKRRRWGAGKEIHFCTGMRTKNYKRFKLGKCHGIQTIKIDYNRTISPGVFIDGQIKDVQVTWKLAINDGFASREEFFQWFNDDFEGVIIHWTAFRY